MQNRGLDTFTQRLCPCAASATAIAEATAEAHAEAVAVATKSCPCMHTDAVYAFGSASTFIRLVADAAVTAEATVCVEGASPCMAAAATHPCPLAPACNVSITLITLGAVLAMAPFHLCDLMAPRTSDLVAKPSRMQHRPEAPVLSFHCNANGGAR